MSTIQNCFLYSESLFTEVKNAISPESFSEDDIIIAVMGTTGAGRTTFINTLTRKEMDVGNDLASRTAEIAPVFCEHSMFPGRRIVLFDTPGFNNTYRSELDIFESIALWLSVTYSEGVKLSGILYLERINDAVISEDSIKNFELFRDLCGSKSLGNAILVTTMWNDVSEAVGARREAELKTKWWKPMVRDGAQVARFHNTWNDGWDIISMLKGRETVVLQIQDEIVTEKKALLDTMAGRRIEEALQGTPRGYHNELAATPELERGMAEAQSNDVLQALIKEREQMEQKLREAKEALRRSQRPQGWLSWLR